MNRMQNWLLLWISILFQAGLLFSADLVRVLPVTDRILQVTFDEGHIDYFGIYEDRYKGNKIYYEALDLSAATDLNRYAMSSADDPAYAVPTHPLHKGSKGKGVDFNNIYDAQEPKVIKHYWIYLELPTAMKTGMTYTLELKQLAGNVNEYTFTYDPFVLRSPAVHVNQIGFVPDAPKYAYASHFMGGFDTEIHQNGGLNLHEYAGNAFHVVRVSDRQIVYSGTMSLQQPKTAVDFTRDDFEHPNMTLADVWQCDFSEFKTPGEYKIVVQGLGCSYPFEIARDIYREPFHYTSRAMFTQRQGIIQEIEPGLVYPRDHRTEDGLEMKYFPNLSGQGKFDPAEAEGNVVGIWGWYHDAGDHDGYAHHYRVPMTLLALYDLKPENFTDGDVNAIYKTDDSEPWIHEGENGLPDLLDEAMWLIKFYKRAKDSLKAQGYSDGGVPGYVGVDAGADGGVPCWEDNRIMALKGGKMVAMTYRYAACAAWLAICLDKFQGAEHPQSAGWINEARAAYDWARNKKQDSDKEINQARMEASAALYRYTADPSFQEDFRNSKNADSSWGNALWFNIQPWHYAATLFSLVPDDHPDLDRDLKQHCIDDLVRKADQETVETANNRGFRYGLDKNILFMLGTFSTPHIYLAAVAYELTSEKRFLDACYTTCDYCLGGNQMDLVKVSGLGEFYELQPFHPSSWYLIDYDSRVYTNPILPGYTIYEMHRTGDWQKGASWSWVGDEDFSRSTSRPKIENFPDSEARFFNRNSIAGSEFTVHQTMCQAIFAYGYLCGTPSGPYIANTRPQVALNLVDNQELSLDSLHVLTVTAFGDVRRVEYYYDWRFIGESTDRENNFRYAWDLSKYKVHKGRILITAKAFDDRGMVSEPTDKGQVWVKFTVATSVPSEIEQSRQFRLNGNYPNPFNPATTIEYELAEDCHVSIRIFSPTGQEVVTLLNEQVNAGPVRTIWDGRDHQGERVASGLYLYSLATSAGFNTSGKMVVLR